MSRLASVIHALLTLGTVVAITTTSIGSAAKEYPAYFLNNDVSRVVGDRSVTRILNTDRRLWIGTQSGLFFYDGSRLRKASSGNPNLHDFFRSHITDLVGPDENGSVWISSLNHGVIRYSSNNNGFDRPFIVDQSVLTVSLLIDRQGDLWVGTDHGVLVYAKDSYKNLTPLSLHRLRQESENVSSLVEDEQGKIWLSSEKGLTQYDPVTMESRPVC